MAVTRADVARAAGVSPAVVSYVLNNATRPVAASTRARVEAAISRLGYRPNAIASALRGGSSRTIGLLTPDFRNPYYAELSEAIERRFLAAGYLVLIGKTFYDRTREERYFHTFVERKVDGLIFTSGVSLHRSPLPNLYELPLVVVDDFKTDTGNIWSIGTDDTADAAITVEHLQRHGHELIGCIAGPARVPTAEARIYGWRAQQRAVSSPSGDELVAFAESSEEGGNFATLALLSKHGRPWAIHGRRPSALFVASDVQAIGALYACFELGLRVPEDVAIASFGGTKVASYVIPPLTTLRQDVEFIATTATSYLLNKIANPAQEIRHMTLHGNLVIGRSCGC